MFVTFLEDRFWKNTNGLSDDVNIVYIPINNLTNGIVENVTSSSNQKIYQKLLHMT